jgi:hypothetical protein
MTKIGDKISEIASFILLLKLLKKVICSKEFKQKNDRLSHLIFLA